MANKTLLILLIMSIKNLAFSQNEANNWYFGANAGITFNNKIVSGLTMGKLYTQEGCASISDKNGHLLFYTDGVQVWDSTHKITPNGKGLNGGGSSTQSAIIIPKPAHSGKYYIFTVGEQYSNYGLEYSVFDFSLNLGKGDINPAQKNIKLVNSTCEKLTAVQHTNGKDYWVLVHKYNSDTIYAYLITSLGIKAPIKSVTGYKIRTPYQNSVGYMKVSPDRTKIALANQYSDTFSIGDFDPNKGIVSNVWNFRLKYAYSLEFSSTSNYLYVAGLMGGSIYQFDAKTKSQINFLTSQIEVDNLNNVDIGALQIGPDKKIYISRFHNLYLDVIHAPDSLGKSCRVQHKYINLSGKSCLLGLPTFLPSYSYQRTFDIKQSCTNDSFFFFILNNNADSVKWNFGDTLSRINNTSKGTTNVSHFYKNFGEYIVSLITFNKNQRDTIKLLVSCQLDIVV